MPIHEVVCFGEVLWDILPDKSLPGGAPMNVAYHLKKLGTNPALITRMGDDEYGKELFSLLTGYGLVTKFFQQDDEHPTGLVYAKPNEQHEVVYDIVFPSAWDFIEWDERFINLTEQAEFFVYGSLTSRNKASKNTLFQILESAKKKVLDINLRPPHFSKDVIEHLLRTADILKMNLAELELITDWFSHFDNMEERMKWMQEKFSIETIIVTMGGNGAAVNDGGVIYYHPGYKVTVADTIGSGDAFLAGFLYKQLTDPSVQHALDFASAMGAFVATRSGACPFYEISEINAVMNSFHQQKESSEI